MTEGEADRQTDRDRARETGRQRVTDREKKEGETEMVSFKRPVTSPVKGIYLSNQNSSDKDFMFEEEQQQKMKLSEF